MSHVTLLKHHSDESDTLYHQQITNTLLVGPLESQKRQYCSKKSSRFDLFRPLLSFLETLFVRLRENPKRIFEIVCPGNQGKAKLWSLFDGEPWNENGDVKIRSKNKN